MASIQIQNIQDSQYDIFVSMVVGNYYSTVEVPLPELNMVHIVNAYLWADRIHTTSYVHLRNGEVEITPRRGCDCYIFDMYIYLRNSMPMVTISTHRQFQAIVWYQSN